MEKPLKYYEVIMGLIGAAPEPSAADNRSALYCRVRDLCEAQKSEMPSFDFKEKRGVLTSADVDIGIRSLKETGMLRVEGYSKLIFTEQGKRFYQAKVRPELKKRELLEEFEKAGSKGRGIDRKL